jgi:cytochrome P450
VPFAAMIDAGFESQSAVLNDCLKHLAANIHVQNRAHMELSKIVGDTRSPNLTDRPHCPYVRACVQGILPLVPSTTNRIAHYTSDKVYYKDCRIPKNTVVAINLWTLSHDESRHEDPTKFCPGRYINDTEGKYQQNNHRTHPWKIHMGCRKADLSWNLPGG